MSEMKYKKEFEELMRKNPELLGGNTLEVQHHNYGALLDAPEYASSYVRYTYDIFCKIKEQLEKLQESNRIMKDALESISKNGCCEPCQEAKLVAISALKKVGEL